MTKHYIKENDYGTFYYKDKACTIGHREDGPAREYKDGDKHWCINDKHHRIDGPAIECNDGSKIWYLNGLIHREDGPAFEHDNGYKEWWLNNKKYSKQEYEVLTKRKNLINFL